MMGVSSNRNKTYPSYQRWLTSKAVKSTVPGGEGEIIKIEERPDHADLLYVHTTDGDLKTVPADMKGIEPLAGVTDQLSMEQFDTLPRFDLLEKAVRLNLAYRFDRFLSLQKEIESMSLPIRLRQLTKS